LISRSDSEKAVSTTIIRLLLVLLFVIWSNSFTAIKHLREIFSPVELIFARFFPVCLFCIAYLLLSRARRRESAGLLRKNWPKLVGLGIFGIAAYNYFLYVGQSEIKPGAAALLTTLVPLFTLILAIPFLKERVPFRRTFGIILAFAGLYIVVTRGQVGMGRVTDIANAEIRFAFITALAPLSWSIYTIIGKDLVHRHSAVTVTYLSIIIGTVPFFAAAGPHFFRTVGTMGWTYWLALAHLSLLCTLVGFYIWITGLKYLPATSVASFVYLNPPLAALFGWLLFGERITIMFLFGSAVVLAGLYMTQRQKDETGR
jgi:drug/metabolite transporter (DMT)-like permease